jgi:O-antigen ligase
LGSFVNALIVGSFASALLAVLLNLAGQATADRVLSALAPLGYPSGDTLRFIASTNIWRATSTSVDPNIFGGLLMVGLLLLLGRLLAAVSARTPREGSGLDPSPQRLAPAIIGLPMMAIMVWALLLSYSRGAWVGLAAGVVFLAVLRYRKALPALVLAGIVAIIGLGNTDFGSHLVSGFKVEDQASAMRIGEYKDALNFISEYPLFGVGFGTTPNGTSAITPEADIYVGVSNIYLLMALEIGLVGTAGFAAVILTLAMWAYRRYRTTDALGKAWIATASATLFAAGVAGIADHYFFRFPHMVALFWALIAILAIATRLAPQGDVALAKES